MNIAITVYHRQTVHTILIVYVWTRIFSYKYIRSKRFNVYNIRYQISKKIWIKWMLSQYETQEGVVNLMQDKKEAH